MRKIIFCAAAAMLLAACYSDKGNYDYTAMTPVEVTGIETAYARKVSDVNLVIDPVLSNEQNFDYCWQIYRDLQQTEPKPDTLALTRKLDLVMDYQLAAGSYWLAFNARDKQTGYTKIVQSSFTVTTSNSMGWYFTKEKDGHVDMDFWRDDATSQPDWIATFNGGLTIPGHAVKTVLMTQYEQVPTDGFTTRALLVATDQDAAIFRVDDGGLSREWDNLFYSAPPSRNIQNVMMPTGFNRVQMVINGRLYDMSLTVANGGAPFAGPISLGTSQLGKFGVFGMNNVVWDPAEKSVKHLNGITLGVFAERTESPLSCNNMGVDPLWMEGYPYPRWRTLMLMPDKLIEMQTDGPGVFWLFPVANPIRNVYPIGASSKMATATVRGGYFDGGVVWLGAGGELWHFNMPDQSETLTWTAPAGEEITLIQHVKFPIPSTGAATDMNTVVVATHNAGHYKIWLAALGAGGILTMPEAPAFEGEGLVKSANWLASPVPTNDGSIIYY